MSACFDNSDCASDPDCGGKGLWYPSLGECVGNGSVTFQLVAGSTCNECFDAKLTATVVYPSWHSKSGEVFDSQQQIGSVSVNCCDGFLISYLYTVQLKGDDAPEYCSAQMGYSVSDDTCCTPLSSMAFSVVNGKNKFVLTKSYLKRMMKKGIRRSVRG